MIMTAEYFPEQWLRLRFHWQSHKSIQLSSSYPYPFHNKYIIIIIIMIPRLFFCLAAIVGNASAFSTMSWSSTATAIHPSATRTRLTLSSSSTSSVSSATDIVENAETDDDVTCYITNDEEIALEGENPHVVCTSEPEEVSQ
jgi:hypothetical protein